MSLRIIFAGSPEFSVPTLEALIRHPDYEVVAVYTQPDRERGRGQKTQITPVKEVALKAEIPIIQPVNFKNPAAIEELATFQPDLLIVVAYGLILPSALLAIPTYGALNIHASLLPRWRGAAPLQRAIEAGDRETGVMIMQMDEGLDTGEVWSEERVAITETTTAGELHDLLKEAGEKLLLETLPTVIMGTQSPLPQNREGATYAKKINKQEAEILWHKNSELLQRHIHAFSPVPGAYTSYEGRLLKIFRVEKASLSSKSGLDSLAIGELWTDNEALFVKTGAGILKLIELQLAGGRRMLAADFIRSREVRGKVLGDKGEPNDSHS